MVSKVSGSTAEFATFRQAVKQRLADSDYVLFHIFMNYELKITNYELVSHQLSAISHKKNLKSEI